VQSPEAGSEGGGDDEGSDQDPGRVAFHEPRAHLGCRGAAPP